MKNRYFMAIAAVIMLGLSACDEGHSTQSCEGNTTKCTNDGQLLRCQDNAWMVNDCEADQICPNNKNACEDKVCSDTEVICNDRKDGLRNCVNNAWIDLSCGGATPVCVENQCVACLDDDIRCDNNVLEHCKDKQWSTLAVCDEKVCNSDKKTCDVKLCEPGTQRCGNNGKQIELCNALGQYDLIETCPAHCSENVSSQTASCVACTANEHCSDEKVCDMTLHSCRAPSSLTSCESYSLLKGKESAYSRVYAKDRTLLNHTHLLCGIAGQAISTYQVIKGTRNAACASCNPEEHEFLAGFSELGQGIYLCLWSFSLGDENPVACQIDGGIVSDFSTIPTAAQAFIYQKDWDQGILFETFKVSTDYKNTETVTISDGMNARVVGGIWSDKSDLSRGSIDNNTLVFPSNSTSSLSISTGSSPYYIGTLAIDYKTWDDDLFSPIQWLTVTINENLEPSFKHVIRGRFPLVQTVTIPINQKITSLRIEKLKASDTVEPRLLIDNVRWTTQEQ